MTEFRNRMLELIMSTCNMRYEVNEDPWFFNSKYSLRRSIPDSNYKDRLILSKIGEYYTSKENMAKIFTRISDTSEEIKHYEILFDLLDNEFSKETLVEISTLRILGQQQIRLSIENQQYTQLHRQVENCLIEKNSKEISNFNDWKLNFYDLANIGYPLKIHYTQMGIVTTYGVEQYAYKKENIVIEENDIVIDCGACWGDTALYFCSKAKNVKVYSFEFIPSNITIFNENIALNPNCQVELIPHPVWRDSSSKFFATDRGPASSVSSEPFSEDDITVTTLSIDDLVKEKGLNRVNFIKMDIEGAEPYALEGAVNTLTRFKPKLAIAIYHCPEDFSRIALFIKNLNLGYKFYVGHFTPHGAETVLFAKAD